MKITVFPRAEASLDASKELEMSWEGFVEAVSEFDTDKFEKTECQLLVPARFIDRTKGKTKQNVKDVSLATLDIDEHVPADLLNEFLDWLREKNYKALVYTTWNHGDAMKGIDKKGKETDPKCKLRVLLPLSRPVKATEWDLFWPAYNMLFDNLADRSCKDASRGYFLPGIPKKYVGTADESLYFIEEIKGERVVDVDSLISGSVEDLKKTAESYVTASREFNVDADDVVKFASDMSKRGKLKELGRKMVVALKGEPFASEGNRDNTIFQFAKELAKEFPEGKPEAVVAPFSAAFSRMAEDAPDAPSLESFKEKVVRAQHAIRCEIQEKRLQKIVDERNESDTSRALSAADMRHYLKTNGYKFDDPLEFKPFVFYGDSMFVFNGRGFSFSRKDKHIYMEAKDRVEPLLKKLGFQRDRVTTNDDGVPVRTRKSAEELTIEYGVVVNAIHHNLFGKTNYEHSIQHSQLNLSEVTLSDIKPVYRPEVNAWMRAVTGSDELLELFRQYLANFDDTTRPLVALAFIGPQATGKTALADGLAKLWKHPISEKTPTPIKAKNAFGNFNDALKNCPIVVSDEAMPRDERGKVNTWDIREFISNRRHALNGKFKELAELEGYHRLIITLNNIENFGFREDFNDQDIEAVASRFLIINTMSMKAKELFDYESFVTKGYLAEHARWLSKQAKYIDKTERFCVKGNSKDQLERRLSKTEKILTRVAAFIDKERIIENEPVRVSPLDLKPVVILPNRTVLVHPAALFERWEDDKGYSPSSCRDLYRHLGAASTVENIGVRTHTGGERKYRVLKVNVERLIEILGTNFGYHEDHAAALLDCYYDLEVTYPLRLKATPETEKHREEAIRKIVNGSFEKLEDEETRLRGEAEVQENLRKMKDLQDLELIKNQEDDAWEMLLSIASDES